MTTTADSSTAMNDSGAPSFGAIRPDRVNDFIDMPEIETDDSGEPDQPDDSLMDPKKRSPKAQAYEKKVRGLMQFAFAVTVRNPKTQADAATILMYGPDFAEATGDLAAENAWAARAVDMITDTTDNAAAAFLMATVPFALQVMRNHEPAVETESKRGLRIPFTKRVIKLRWSIKLKRARKFTHPPDAMMQHVFTNPAVFEKLSKQGIVIKGMHQQ